jgi:hypothetical protein
MWNLPLNDFDVKNFQRTPRGIQYLGEEFVIIYMKSGYTLIRKSHPEPYALFRRVQKISPHFPHLVLLGVLNSLTANPPVST